MNSVGMSGEKPFLIGAGRIPGPAAGRLFGFSIIGSPDGASRHTSRFRRTGSLAKDAVHLAAGILFLDVLALVVAFASLGQSDLQLGQPPFVDEQLQSDDGQPLVLQRAPELFELLALQ